MVRFGKARRMRSISSAIMRAPPKGCALDIPAGYGSQGSQKSEDRIAAPACAGRSGAWCASSCQLQSKTDVHGAGGVRDGADGPPKGCALDIPAGYGSQGSQESAL